MKTKKILAAVAALSIVCGAVPSQPFASIVKNSAVTANAEDSEPITFSYYTDTDDNGDEYVVLSRYSDSGAEEIEIPSEIEGLPVKHIEYNAFSNMQNLKRVVLADSVESIWYDAFYNCTNLEEVVLSNNLKNICLSAFYQCTSLKEIVIPDSVETIAQYAFADCTSLKKAVIPANVTKIEEKAFGYYRNEDDEWLKTDDLKIYGEKGSAAEEYANENGFEFIELEDVLIPEFILGDADGDGAITAMDASAALTYYVMEPESIEELGFPFSFKAADWDGNGIINAIDASAILTYYVENN